MSRALPVLAGEAVRDGVRRRIVPVVAVLSLLSLLVVDSCTSCQPTVVSNGEELTANIGAWSGGILFVVLGLWMLVLAGVLAADSLSQTLRDGTALLCLARPVSREAFAVARLLGSLAITGITAAVLLGGTALLMQARLGVELAPALQAGLACAVGALTVGSLAMLASLVLPPVPTSLAVLGLVAGVAFANSLSLGGAELGGALGALDRIGPPLCSAMVASLEPWIEPAPIHFSGPDLALRSGLWAAGSVALLLAVFRRRELAA